ncbi:hypothetical protein KCP70_22725 [Salmonella enterica subsp. enterica]|nr:hypothetical protein KCP70_22725 [Salmonella enterica subsp. enterica]
MAARQAFRVFQYLFHIESLRYCRLPELAHKAFGMAGIVRHPCFKDVPIKPSSSDVHRQRIIW